MKGIEKTKYYTLAELVRLDILYYTSFSKVRMIVEQDMKTTKILNPIVNGDGRGKKYLIKGENIIKFLAGIETGKVNIPPKTK